MGPQRGSVRAQGPRCRYTVGQRPQHNSVRGRRPQHGSPLSSLDAIALCSLLQPCWERFEGSRLKAPRRWLGRTPRSKCAPSLPPGHPRCPGAGPRWCGGCRQEVAEPGAPSPQAAAGRCHARGQACPQPVPSASFLLVPARALQSPDFSQAGGGGLCVAPCGVLAESPVEPVWPHRGWALRASP